MPQRPSNERRLLGAQPDACARIGTRAPRRPHFVDGKHTIMKMQIIEVMQNIPTGATDMSVPPRSVEHVLAGFDLLDCRVGINLHRPMHRMVRATPTALLPPARGRPASPLLPAPAPGRGLLRPVRAPERRASPVRRCRRPWATCTSSSTTPPRRPCARAARRSSRES